MTPVFANVLQPLIDLAERVLLFFHNSVGVSWGLSIIFLTLVVRLLLLPLTLRQAKSMRHMQVLSPKIKELQAKYKEDKQRLNQEMMKFYSENKVNPLSSCLPLVLQFPFFISLFYMLRHDLRFDVCPQVNPPGTVAPKPCGADNGADFLFIPDLTNRATGAVLIALLVLYVGSQLASSLMMSTTMDKNQRRLILFLPVVLVAFILNFPAGLLVYWITTNCWTIVQQYIVRRSIGPPPVLATAGAGGQGGGLSGLLDQLRGGTGGEPAGNGGKDGDGARAANGGAAREPAATAASARGSGTARAASSEPARVGPAAPPPQRRKKKKRSGRRR